MESAKFSSGTTFKMPALSAETVKEAKMRKACGDFEALMLRQLLAAMRESVPESGLFSGGYAEKMYRSMQDEQLAATLAHDKGMGFGEALFRELVKQIRPSSK